MESVNIDKTKVRTIKNYAKDIGVTVQAVYQMIKEDRVPVVHIDGKIFILKG